MKKSLFCFMMLLSLLLHSNILQAQNQEDNSSLVQFSGITITADSLNPVPYTKIIDIG